jgi:hypothetical protein
LKSEEVRSDGGEYKRGENQQLFTVRGVLLKPQKVRHPKLCPDYWVVYQGIQVKFLCFFEPVHELFMNCSNVFQISWEYPNISYYF